MRAWVAAVALSLLVFGCGSQQESGEQDGPESPATTAETEQREVAEKTSPPGAEVPAYDVTAEPRPCDAGLSQPATCVSLSTDATSVEDMEAVARDLGQQNPNANALIITFFPNEPQATSSGSGFVFSDQESAMEVLSTMYPQDADVGRKVDEAMRNDGVYARAGAAPVQASNPEASQYGDGAQVTPDEQAVVELGNCQALEARRALGPEGYAALEEEFIAQVETAEPGQLQSIQEFLLEKGYDCNGTAQEILDRN